MSISLDKIEDCIAKISLDKVDDLSDLDKVGFTKKVSVVKNKYNSNTFGPDIVYGTYVPYFTTDPLSFSKSAGLISYVATHKVRLSPIPPKFSLGKDLTEQSLGISALEYFNDI